MGVGSSTGTAGRVAADGGEQSAALAGVRVLDLAGGLPGSMVSMLLADFGADVITVLASDEQLDRPVPEFLFAQRNKTLAVADPATAAGAASVSRLARRADLVIVDGTRTELAARGLGPGDLWSGGHPARVRLWLPPYDDDGGPDVPSSPLVLAALCGLADIHAASWDRPALPVIPYLGYQQAVLGATQAVAALLQRQHARIGADVTVSGLHAAALMFTVNVVDGAGVVRPMKAAAGTFPHYRHYACGDGQWLYLGALTQPFFLRALDVLDLMDVMVEPGVDGDFLRLMDPAVAAPVIERITDRFAQRPRDAWLEALGQADVPCAPIDDRDTWKISDAVRALEMLPRIPHPVLGDVTVPGLPVTLSRTPARLRHLPGREQLRDPDACWTAESPVWPVGCGADSGTDAASPGGGPLGWLRCSDSGSFVAAPLAAAVLARLGADVVKVEPPGGDPYREMGLAFASANRGKRSVTVNLKSADGWDQLLALAGRSDVLLDNLRPSVRGRLGLDDTAAQANPALVRCSVTGYGSCGPLAAAPGFDPLIQSRSGMMRAQGGSDAPVFSVTPVLDVMTGTLAALGVCIALFERGRSGLGQHVEVSLAATSVLAQAVELVGVAGRVPPQVGATDWSGPDATHRLYQCRDGWVLLVAGLPASQAASILGVDSRTLGADAETAAVIADRVAGMEVAEVRALTVGTGVHVVPVLPRQRLFDDRWLRANGFFTEVQDPLFGPVTVADRYARWAGYDGLLVRPCPLVGEHTDEVLGRYEK
ncbi:MAG TPA: CoA transferase [Mycobacteriales bacterium]|nr:CoA transferase [Mycobacteriales bacterium]